MLIAALVLAAIGLAALVTAVVTSNEILAFVCIAAAAIGVVLMIVDAIRDRHAGALKADDGEKAAPAEDADEDQDQLEASAEDSDDEPHESADVAPEADAAVPEASGSEDAADDQAEHEPAPVSVKEAATAAHHPTAEETYDRFDEIEDDEPETGHKA